ncbi:iron chaperone [Anaerorhabdus sp.]|uniref:iron chaperone n=1 Tax=Anaerorhabdus sp. TaxID=1872524 RepID=UPI002FCA4C24
MTVIDDYIATCPVEHQPKLIEIRTIIKKAAPQAEEKISWGMPTFYLNGNLVHFALAKKHIGFYPGASGVSDFEERIQEYKHSKGAIQFPLDKPLPKKLIMDIVKFRIKENCE